MAYNTQNILTDQGSKPIPQYYNSTGDVYEALQGTDGATRVLLWDSTGNVPLLTQTNAGYVRSSDGAIATIGALADASQTNPATAASVVALLKGILSQAQGGGSVKTQTDVIDRAARVLGKMTADDGAVATIGALADAAKTDPTVSASLIALLKGLLKQLQGTGTGAAPVTLSGRNATIIQSWTNIAYNAYNLATANAHTDFGANVQTVGGSDQFIDITGYEDIGIVFANGTNQSYTVQPNFSMSQSSPIAVTTPIAGQSCAAGAILEIMKSGFAAMDDSRLYINIHVNTGTTAPTSGTISLYLIGRKH